MTEQGKPKRRAAQPFAVNDPRWDVVAGGIGLYIEPANREIPPFYLRIRSAADFRAFMLAAVDQAMNAWPEIAEDFELSQSVLKDDEGGEPK